MITIINILVSYEQMWFQVYIKTDIDLRKENVLF